MVCCNWNTGWIEQAMDWMTGVWLLTDADKGCFSVCHCMQTSSGVKLAPYPVGTTVSFPGGKAAGA
jgi:hypothetical protein